MMNKKDIKKLAKKISLSRRGLQSPKIMHPMRDWFTGVVITLLIFGVSAAWSAYTYLGHKDKAVTSDAESSVDMTVYREAQVKAALEDFSVRKNEHEEMLRMAREAVNSETESSDIVAEEGDVEEDAEEGDFVTTEEVDEDNEESEEVPPEDAEVVN